MATYDPLSIAIEIREQLASEKRRLGFFFGAGTSMAVGLPGINELTRMVGEKLSEPAKSQFAAIKKDLPEDSNVEILLDRIRIYRELIGESKKKEYATLKGPAAKNLDSHICQAICDIVCEDPSKGLAPHLVFAKWLRALHSYRDWPAEIFTTNYDLLFERAMEDSGVPFFDGFIGSVAPFFMPESVEMAGGKTYTSLSTPATWTRLWKMHGSINWSLQKKVQDNRERITRLSGSQIKKGEELVIFPSREKYAQSRKLPFIAFQDRFRKFLSLGECHVVVVGYSFSDEHLNDIIFQALRSNPRLAVTAFIYSDLTERIIQYGIEHRNLAIYGPDKSCVGGLVKPWSDPGSEQKKTECGSFWDVKSKRFTLGDFVSFTSFLEVFIGFRQTLSDTEKDIPFSTKEGIPTQNAF